MWLERKGLKSSPDLILRSYKNMWLERNGLKSSPDLILRGSCKKSRLFNLNSVIHINLSHWSTSHTISLSNAHISLYVEWFTFFDPWLAECKIRKWSQSERNHFSPIGVDRLLPNSGRTNWILVLFCSSFRIPYKQKRQNYGRTGFYIISQLICLKLRILSQINLSKFYF